MRQWEGGKQQVTAGGGGSGKQGKECLRSNRDSRRWSNRNKEHKIARDAAVQKTVGDKTETDLRGANKEQLGNAARGTAWRRGNRDS